MIFLYNYVLLVLSGSAAQCLKIEFKMATPLSVPQSTKDHQTYTTDVMKDFVRKYTEDVQINNPSNLEQKEMQDMEDQTEDTTIDKEASEAFLDSFLKAIIKESDDFVKNMTVKDKVSENKDYVDVGNYDYENEAVKTFIKDDKTPISVKLGLFEPEFENYGQKRFGIVVKPIEADDHFRLIDTFKINKHKDLT